MSIFPEHRINPNIQVCMGLKINARKKDFLYFNRLLDIYKYDSGGRGEYDDIKKAIGNALELVSGDEKIDSFRSIMANSFHYKHNSLPKEFAEAVISELENKPYPYRDESDDWD